MFLVNIFHYFYRTLPVVSCHRRMDSLGSMARAQFRSLCASMSSSLSHSTALQTTRFQLRCIFIFTCNPHSSSRPAARSSNHTFHYLNSKSIGRTYRDSPDPWDWVCIAQTSQYSTHHYFERPTRSFCLGAQYETLLAMTYIVVQDGKAGC